LVFSSVKDKLVKITPRSFLPLSFFENSMEYPQDRMKSWLLLVLETSMPCFLPVKGRVSHLYKARSMTPFLK
jgi:hypothetical protein